MRTASPRTKKSKMGPIISLANKIGFAATKEGELPPIHVLQWTSVGLNWGDS